MDFYLVRHLEILIWSFKFTPEINRNLFHQIDISTFVLIADLFCFFFVITNQTYQLSKWNTNLVFCKFLCQAKTLSCLEDTHLIKTKLS